MNEVNQHPHPHNHYPSHKQKKAKTKPPSFKDMVGIALGLMVACVISAFVLGLCYLWTGPIKAKNLETREANTILRLLEISPLTGAAEEIRRYMSESRSEIYYVANKRAMAFTFEGQKVETPQIPAEILSKTGDARIEALKHWMAQNKAARFVGRFFVGREHNKVAGYVVEGENLGYKNKIRFFVAMNSEFTIRGVEVIEQEEDPGLGGEISQKYFKNQFAGRTSEKVEALSVTTTPLPKDWKKVVESLGAIPYSQWSMEHQQQLQEHSQIYAITGSTISSDALTQGVKKTVNNFKLRMKLLEGSLL